VRILLVEDDPPLAASLEQALKKQGFAVNRVGCGEACLHVVRTDPPDIIILDLGLPDMDGLGVLKRIRSRTAELPVLLLTARDSIEDKVRGLDGGADDYLAKPFDMPELLARLRVLERRLGTVKTNDIRIGAVRLDSISRRVWLNEAEIELARREYALLKTLMENAGKVIPRGALESSLYGWDEEVSSNALEVHVHHLRRKLGAEFIRTIHGVGYKVDAR
jgi:DNA-binding response OmpR family regulator